MKTRTKVGISVVAVLLSFVMLLNGIILGNSSNETGSVIALTRTMELSIAPEYETYLKDFEDKSIKYDEECVSFHGIMEYDERVLSVFDRVALAENIDAEQSNIAYDCAFDMESMQFTFRAMLLDENNNVIEIDEMVTDAFVTETGQLDAYIEIDGETYLLSDYVSTNAIDECLFGWLKALIVVVVVIVVYVVVAETAEQIKAKQNYEYNKQLEASGRGVTKNTYITGQNRTNVTGNNPGNYRFGFTSFSDVGCEVAAAYNAMIALERAEMLSETIYCFEKWAIEFAIAWGNFGSNPLQISTFLKKKDIGFSKITNYSSFKSAVENEKSCHIIMSRWNDPWTDGLHTFYVEKKANSEFYAYNWDYYDNSPSEKKDNIDVFNDGSAFIVGYIVWAK